MSTAVDAAYRHYPLPRFAARRCGARALGWGCVRGRGV